MDSWKTARRTRYLALGGIAAAALLSPAPSAAQPAREHISVDVVQVTVAAHGRAGAQNLAASDFELRVDGKRVPIETFSAGPSSPARGNGSTPESAGGSGNAVGPEPPLETAILVDESTTGILDRRDVYDQLIQFLGARPVPSQYFLVARFRRGSLKIECPWTDDSKAALAAIVALRKHPNIELVPSAGVITGSHTSMLEFEILRRRLLAALIQVAAAFPNHSARRQLILVSGGATLAPAFVFAQEFSDAQFGSEREGARGNERQTQAPANTAPSQRPGQDSIDNFERWTRAAGGGPMGLSNADVVAKALERDIALIPIHASAFDRGINPGADRKTLKVSTPGSVALSPHLAVAQTMMSLAEETGSQPVLVPRRAAKALKELSEQTVFTITFRDPSAGDHRFHQIALTCLRPGVTLNYRRGYRFETQDERILDAVFARLLQPTEGGTDLLSTRASMARIVGTDGRHSTRLTVRYVPPREHESAPERKCDLIVVGRDADGTWTEPIRWSGTATSLADSEVFETSLDLRIPSGSFVWSIALRDEATMLVGFAVARSSPTGEQTPK